MNHQVVACGSEWQDRESGERNDDYLDECIVCGAIEPPDGEECPGRKEEEDEDQY